MDEGGGGEKTRIFIGGLGVNVTSDELSKLFTSCGDVESVHIVRTKGRSFAYVDFVSSSTKSLHKLISTYNGCLWKGGRLKLEKAKEHYLSCLTREWDEAIQPVNTRDDVESITLVKKPPNKAEMEKKHIDIFFPRLKKVKSLPFSGTGKHKYSFRRVEVPSRPSYFCDCEEHSGNLHAAKEQNSDVKVYNGEINEEEINIMNSVMSKLFERENPNSIVDNKIELVKDGADSMKLIGDQKLEENEMDIIEEDDNLVLNVVTRSNSAGSSESQQIKTILSNQEWRLNKKRHSREVPARNQHEVKEISTFSPNKKIKCLNKENHGDASMSTAAGCKGSLSTQINDGSRNFSKANIKGKVRSGEEKLVHSNGLKQMTEEQAVEAQSSAKSSTKFSWSQKGSWRELVGGGGRSAFNVSHLLPGGVSLPQRQPLSDAIICPTENQNCETNEKPELQSDKTKQELGQSEKPVQVDVGVETEHINPIKTSDKTGRGPAWRHKQSWIQLISDSEKSSFSITQLLPGATFTKQEPQLSDERGFKHTKFGNAGDFAEEETISKHEGDVEAKDEKIIADDKKVCASTLKKPRDSIFKATHAIDISIGETCSFIRSAASLKDWAKAKASLISKPGGKRKMG